MKKNNLILWLLALSSLWLVACGNSKDFTMSFEEALDTANHSALQDILASTDNFQQSFDISTNINKDWSKIIASLNADSKQNLNNTKSESSTNFEINVNSEESTLNVTWSLDIKSVDDVIYLNLKSLGISWPEDTSFLDSMVGGFTNQWYFVEMTWLGDIPNSLSYMKDAKNLNNKAKEIFLNEGSLVYSWKFNQFNWYNAWKFSLDNDKLQELINEYYASISESLWEEENMEAPQVNIDSCEWYLVITWKDKVTTVIENMSMIENDMNISIDGFGWENYQITMYESWTTIASISATKKWANYNVLVNASDLIIIDWVVTPKVSTSNISVKFDANVTIKSQYEDSESTIIPLKGSRTYEPISDFSVDAPDNAQDLSEMVSSYLWWMFWTTDYEDYNWDSDDYYVNEWLDEYYEEIAQDEAIE